MVRLNYNLDMTTAFSLLAHELLLDAQERAVTHALLRSTPVAITGEETIAPKAALQEFLDTPKRAGPRDDPLVKILRRLVETPRKLTIATAPDRENVLTLSVLTEFKVNSDGLFVAYTLNTRFLDLLKSLQAQRGLVDLY